MHNIFYIKVYKTNKRKKQRIEIVPNAKHMLMMVDYSKLHWTKDARIVDADVRSHGGLVHPTRAMTAPSYPRFAPRTVTATLQNAPTNPLLTVDSRIHMWILFEASECGSISSTIDYPFYLQMTQMVW